MTYCVGVLLDGTAAIGEPEEARGDLLERSTAPGPG
jgi:hypothetical protein